MSVQSLDRPGPWTFDQLAELPDDGRRYEVVDGNLVVTPPPSHFHQLVSSVVADVLRSQCPRGGACTRNSPCRWGLMVGCLMWR